MDITNRHELAESIGESAGERYQDVILAIEDWRARRAVDGIGAHPVPEVLRDALTEAGWPGFAADGGLIEPGSVRMRRTRG